MTDDRDEQDRSLARRIAARDQAAVQELYERYAERLLAFVLSRLDESDAYEVFSNVWLKLMTKPPVKDGQHVSGWLFRVAKNEMMDHFRWKQREQKKMRRFEDDGVEPAIHADQSDPEEQRKTDLHECIEELPDEFKGVASLYVLGASHETIADTLNIKLGTTYTRLGRGKERLIDCMQRKGWKTKARAT